MDLQPQPRERPPGMPEYFHGPAGSSASFVALIIVSATFPSLIRNLSAVLFPNCVLFNNRKFWVTLIVDFCIAVLPVELMITIWNVQSHYFFAVTCCFIAVLFSWILGQRRYRDAMMTSPLLSLPMSPRLPFISYFRAYTNIFTGFSILAVDFAIYPTYFYKSRVYGTALMDSGLGFYMISNAIVSPEARGIISTRSVTSSIIKGLKDTIPLIILGFSRFYVTGMADYHVPVQEYGVHWNFFFTLGVVKMLSTILFCVTPFNMRVFLGPGIILVYQYFLSNTWLHNFVLFGFHGDASRDGILEANREGIVASIGFLAIYFIGVQLGTILLKKRETIGEWSKATVYITVVCCSSYSLMHLCGIYIERPSRKFANLAYMFFVVGVTSLLMVQGLVFDIIITYFKHLTLTTLPTNETQQQIGYDRTCPLLQAINYNGLLFFTFANLMTGAINLSTDTESYSQRAAFIIVNIYMLILSTIFLHLYRRKFVFKSFLWRTDKGKGSLPK